MSHTLHNNINQAQLPDVSAPPPYAPPAGGFTDDEQPDDEAVDTPTTTISIHAPTTIHGSGNLISIPSPDLSRLTAAILATWASRSGQMNQQHVHIHVNCGVNIIGDKNMVGAPALRPLMAKSPQSSVTRQAEASPPSSSSVESQNGNHIPSRSPNVLKRTLPQDCRESQPVMKRQAIEESVGCDRELDLQSESP